MSEDKGPYRNEDTTGPGVQPVEEAHTGAALIAERRSFFWYFAERPICGKPVHHQHHAACVRNLGHGSDIECDGYYEPTVDERIALWRASEKANRYICPPCARGDHHACSEPGVCCCTIHPDTGEDEDG